MSTIDAMGWAPVIRGPFRAGKAEKAAVLTCYVCQCSQVYMDRPEYHREIVQRWTRDANGWRHKECRQ